ncbi:MAG TPA: type II toxin-antitoxin system HipA family toxin [Micromonosporaceae bacterium]|nr:type II toxin-antitoxin system HipA family toxin [Micromonosporaceae bacterium]
MTGPGGKVLIVLIYGRRAGTVTQGSDGRLTLTYDEMWQSSSTATPVSLSMPLARRAHDDSKVRAFLWGLLPDNEQVLDRWAQDHQVSARNPFALLHHVGEDCAGAVQLATPDRAEAVLAGEGGVKLVDEDEIARRIRVLRRDPAAWHLSNTGQFSLAGAQAKTALYFDSTTQRWGDPWGAVATTHILKPAVSGFNDHDLNEHLCLETARHLGMNAASSQVASFGGERVIVVERYDRIRRDGTALRIHQEDMCQALGLPPTAKYQNDGGPTPEQIISLLRQEIRPSKAAVDDIARFVDALAFNWIIAGTDAHAKNYSLLLTGAQVRLAPMYDVASALPYDDMYLPRLRMAMRIGGEYRIEAAVGRHWRRFAAGNSLDPDATIARIDDLAARVPANLARATGATEVRELGSDLPARLLDQVTARAARCRKALAQS